MINYANQLINIKGCLGCAYAKHLFGLPCGIAFENDKFILSQDWELPIQGFFVVSPKRCVEKFCELTDSEQIEIFSIVNKTINILRNNLICDRFNVVFEEKENRHFHIWIMPRHQWMKDVVGEISNNFGKIFNYALENMKTKENLNKISQITEIVRKEFNESIYSNSN